MKSKYKLKRNELFQKTFEKGAKNKFKNLFFINILENKENDNAKFGFAVSKKFGNAPYRNKIKRQVRAIFSENNLDAIENNNYVLVFSKFFCEMSFKDKKRELNEYLKLLKNGNFKKQKEKQR